VETSQGPWFIKLTGPDASVKAGQSGFESLLQSLQFK
jgi:hypothetical protein